MKKIGFYFSVWMFLNAILAIAWTEIEAAAFAFRTSTACGGEFLLWLMPICAVIAIDTLMKGKENNET